MQGGNDLIDIHARRDTIGAALQKSDIRNLSRYMAELEELIESYRAFAATATLSAPADRATQHKLLKRMHKIIGPPPNALAETRPELARCEDLVT